MQFFDRLDALDRFMYTTGNKDKIFAVAQFLPLALSGIVEKCGAPALGASIANLGKMADTTRAVNRLTLLAGALSSSSLKAVAVKSPWLIAQHVFHTLFCIFENTAVYAGQGVLPARLTRLGGCAVTCWFYVLLIDIVAATHELFLEEKASEEKTKALKLRLTKDWFYIIFSLSCMPAGGPKLMRKPGGPLEALDLILRYIAPPHVAMDNSLRGLLGLGATACEFYFADPVTPREA